MNFQTNIPDNQHTPIGAPTQFEDLQLTRTQIKDAIERLLTLLDSMDGDVDLEDDDPAEDADHGEVNGDDEPYLSAAATDWNINGANGNEADYEVNGPIEGAKGYEHDKFTTQYFRCYE